MMHWRRKRQAVRQRPPIDWRGLIQQHVAQLRAHRRVVMLTLFGVVLIASVWLSWHLVSTQPALWPVKRVFVCRLQEQQCLNLQRAKPHEVRKTIQALLQDGMLFVFPAALQQALSALAWVKEARVIRRWPFEVRVEIEEYQAVARWWPDNTYCHSDAPRCAMLDNVGNIFAVKQQDWDADLPCLSGPADSASVIFQRWQTLQPILQAQHQSIRCLHMSARRHWDLTLADGTLLRLGRQDLESRLQRFFKVHSILLRDSANVQIAHFDLRYPNGVVVQWR
jgi:cell division protein FtsQ